MLSELLDLVFDNYPEQPEWAEVKTLAYQSEKPVELITELCRVLFLYGEDPAAFDTYMYSLGE